MPKRMFILTGEVSGELYASELIKQLKKENPDLQIDCTGSSKLKKIGANSIIDLSKLSSIGYTEVIPQLINQVRAFRTIKKYLKKTKPDLVLAIDNQGFNVQVLKYAKKINLQTAYFIAPQEWQWGKKENGIKIGKIVDTLFSIFEEEHEFYLDCGANSIYIGHPLKELITNFQKELPVAINKRKGIHYIGIFPGSRKQEIKLIAPTLFKAAKLIQNKLNNCQFYCCVTSKSDIPRLKKLIHKYKLNCELYTENSYHIIPQMDFSICKSGTNILEHTFFETPCLSAYTLSPLTTWIVNKLLRKKFEKKYTYFSLPNIISKSFIIPEFYLENFNEQKIANSALSYLQSQKNYQQLKNKIQEFNTSIKPDQTLKSLSKYCLNLLSN